MTILFIIDASLDSIDGVDHAFTYSICNAFGHDGVCIEFFHQTGAMFIDRFGLLNTVIEILYQTMTIICVFDNSAGMSSEILTSIEGKGSCCFL